MFRLVAGVCAFVLANGDALEELMDIEENDAISLLQIAASHSQAQRDPMCLFHGDTHGPFASRNQNKNYYGKKQSDPQKYGLFQVTQSNDGKVSVQAFQCASTAEGNVGWITMVGYNLDGNVILVTGPNWDQMNTGPFDWSPIKRVDGDGIVGGCCGIRMQINVNGKQYDSDDLPFEIEGTNIRLEGLGAPENGINGPADELVILAPGMGEFKTTMHGSSAMAGDSQPFMYMNTKTVLASDDLIPPEDANTWCTKGHNAEPLDWDASVFTVAAHQNVCSYCNGWNKNMNLKTDWECVAPPPLPPHPEARDECAKNECSFAHGEQMCASLKGDDKLFGDCVSDFCISCKDIVAADAVEEEERENPKPICAQGADECEPEAVCNEAVKMNTLNVAQSNLGGAGPDSGAEEIRYANAAVINGQKIDLVITADGPYNAYANNRNGNNDGGFGIINLKCGTSTTLLFKAVNSETGAPVTLDKVAITWYDIDEGKKAKGRESVQVCGTTGAVISGTTTLTTSAVGDCHTATSSVAGTGKDNPSSPYTLTSEHLARAATFPFAGVSEFSSTVSLARGYKGRNFMFAIEPTVACA